MTRRARPTSFGQYASGLNRMAPGGRARSESRVNRALYGQPSSGTATESPPPPSDVYYVDPSRSGYSATTNPNYWVLTWATWHTGPPLLPVEGIYDCTFTFTLINVHPTATTITINQGSFGIASPYLSYVTGGPFTTGQVISLTFVGAIYPDYNNDLDIQRVAASGTVEWTTDLATSFMTLGPRLGDIP